MKKTLGILAVALLVVSPLAEQAGAGHTRSERGYATTQLFAFGGTQVSNGFFFPGPVVCAGTDCVGEEAPLVVPKGNDVEFVNLDPAAAANCHQIQSFKRNKRTKRPLFASSCVAGPGREIMITSHLKRGAYHYQCTTHYGMRGIIEVE